MNLFLKVPKQIIVSEGYTPMHLQSLDTAKQAIFVQSADTDCPTQMHVRTHTHRKWNQTKDNQTRVLKSS